MRQFSNLLEEFILNESNDNYCSVDCVVVFKVLANNEQYVNP
jgi:hypothetical protein